MSGDFLLINAGAANAIVQATVLQSTEFSAGARLAELIKRQRSTLHLSNALQVVPEAEGIYLLKPGDPEHCLVIDFTVVDPFSRPADEALTIFQRLLRFSVRHWAARRASSADRHIQGSTKFAVFPFSIGTQSGYRITVETSPDPKRVARRFPGKHILAYQDGYDVGAGPTFTPEIRVFRAAFDGLRQAMEIARDQASIEKTSQAQAPESLKVCSLSKRDAGPISPHIGFDKWMTLLTKAQKDFVTRMPESAERIEGPAGTGKTLCLVLKCINALRNSREKSVNFHAAFFAHSEATRLAIESVFRANCLDLDTFFGDELTNGQTLTITTLQMWCAGRLGRATVTEAQFLDQDALTAKEYRRLIIEDCVREALDKDFPTHKPFLSEAFVGFLEGEDVEVIADLLQHEIGVMVKGRAGENLDVYRDLPPVNYGLPCETPADRSFVFIVYRRYAKTLIEAGEFDTDDIVLTALASLENPIWRRRRSEEGFDALFVDETHLFNLNELSIFHHLTRASDRSPIAFSVDRSQAPGDRGLTRALIDSAVAGSPGAASSAALRSVFRSSRPIIELVASVTASGAGLFVGFEDPMQGAEAIETETDEEISAKPILLKYPSDEAMCAGALDRAKRIANQLDCPASSILLVAFSQELLSLIRETAARRNTAIEVIERRGDLRQVEMASNHSRIVVALPDYVGGLEFSAVVLIGVDEGRVPPTPVTAGSQSRHFLSFRAHNHLYVAMTRARYRLEVLANTSRGPSRMLSAALSNGLLEEEQA